MTPAPLISIVLPVFNDEATVAAALESALRQTLPEIEVICVDDASTDGTAAVIERFCARDPRVRLIRQERNLSAFQARRAGIFAAEAEHLLFLDGDDELVPDAAEKALARAHAAGADLVGFGVTVVERDGSTGNAYERRLQPVHRALDGAEVLRGLFPIGTPAQGQLWRYLFRTRVLRDAHALLPDELALPRVNDLPLMFLVAALATSYVSTDDKLYRYHFGRGGSGHRIDSVERAEFYASAITSIDSIRPAVQDLSLTCSDATLLRESYESARLSIIGYVCSQVIDKSDSTVLDAALAHLHTVASAHDIVHAAARFYPATLTTLKFHTTWQGIGDRPVRSVLLATSTLRTGGVSAVLASQARYLRDAGYRVTVVARSAGSDTSALPAGTPFVELTARDLVERLQQWGEICRTHEIDVVIDHQVLYTNYWPEFALMARAEGAATIGWVHNFVARPVYDGNDRLTLIERCSSTLAQLVTLSPLDVAYFKLRGVMQVSYLPNPPSPLLVESAAKTVDKMPPTDRVELVWWGRLEQRTKQVYELIEVGVQLRQLGIDFRLTVIGPDWDDVTAKKFNARARRRGVGDHVVAVGPRRGEQLIRAIDAADAFVTTSIIEGFQLTIAEAQSRGLPVFMYELPWLTLVQDNDGVVSVPQGDARGLAGQIADVIGDTERYARLSRTSLDAAQRALTYDFAQLYRGVVTGTLGPEFSPEPTLSDARELLGLMVFFAGRAQRRGRTSTPDSSALGARLWKSAAPIGRATLTRIPGLRPLAHRAKGWLRAR
ncbi:glycosyltransferase [Microbacterium invictum]|uniref:Glycosyltransferase involved in cell wall biosynthesis n=1 Tax=Microbacterium invictum TaxID=515415 RepID=A0AA40SPP1_9MICO|nr:glycosyltransferase [Microbacterium invictum]MBB4140125.1 glycosyltransferase involved in cell wall biosynthesis [Microbacterium invictum]